MHDMDNKFKYMYIDYKNNKYVINENGEININDKNMSN